MTAMATTLGPLGERAHGDRGRAERARDAADRAHVVGRVEDVQRALHLELGVRRHRADVARAPRRLGRARARRARARRAVEVHAAPRRPPARPGRRRPRAPARGARAAGRRGASRPSWRELRSVSSSAPDSRIQPSCWARAVHSSQTWRRAPPARNGSARSPRSSVRPQTSQEMSCWFVRMSRVRATTSAGSRVRADVAAHACDRRPPPRCSATFCARCAGISS